MTLEQQERHFWRKVFLKAMRAKNGIVTPSQTAEYADRAVEEYRKRIPAEDSMTQRRFKRTRTPLGKIQ